MNGWRRIGVVLAVLWFVGFGWWLRQDSIDEAWRGSGFAMCSMRADIRRGPLRWDDPMVAQINGWERECKEQASAKFRRDVAPLWAVLLSDFISIALLWLLAEVFVWIGRWVAVGFWRRA